MKRNHFCKIISLILAVSMMIMLGACNSSTSQKDDSPATTSSNKDSSTVSGSSTGKPAEVVTLQVFSMPSNKSGLIEGWMGKLLEEKAGVKLELIPAGDQGEQKLQALMAGGELPDVVVFKDKKQVADAVKAGLLLNLNEHVDKLPNAVKYASTAMKYYSEATGSGEGKAYAIPNLIGSAEVGAEINWGPVLRWDLYKKLGTPEINTLEDYLPLLKKMQDLEPKNKDGQKVYGFSLWKDWDSTAMMQAYQPACLYGIDLGDQLGGSLPFLQVDFNNTGNVENMLNADSQYIRALKFYYDANKMGLVDPDSLTQRFDTALQKMENGRVLFGWWSWFSSYNKAENTQAEPPKGVRPVPAKDFKPEMWGDNIIGNTWAFAVGASTKNVDACLRYIDFMYSPEGLFELSNGPKGGIWDVNDKNEAYITDAGWDIMDNNKELPAELGGGKLSDGGLSIVNSYGLSGTTKCEKYNQPISNSFWQSTMEHKPSKLMQDWRNTTGYKTTVEMLKAKNMYTIVPMAAKLIETMPDDIKSLSTQVGDVIKTNSWLMVFAKNEAEYNKYYQDMVKKADGLGIQKIIDWDKAAWNKALEEAKKYK